ncbi:MAG TPA: cytochrome P450 [Sandaracinaceae bacterium LLY-WYZ-13_1]|nr:cytochrome P450 [Sandaracinaceae bacterium LLY-WYZ-13_1]
MAAVTEVLRRPARRRETSPTEGAMPPGPRWPRVAQLAGWLYRPYELLEHCRRTHGTPFTLRLPGWRTLVVFDDPQANKEVFTAPWRELYAGEANEPLRPVVGGHSLLLLDGERHVRERKLLLPPFHGQRMHRYGTVMREVAERDLATWPVGEPFAVQPHTQAITLDIILRTVFGVEEGAAMDRLREALVSLIADFSRPSLIVPVFQRDLGPRSPWGRFVRTRARTHALLAEEIEHRRRDRRQRDDVLSLLLAARHEDGTPMSGEELRDELITLLVAGHETTATALSWAFHHLTTRTDVQRRVHEELDAVFGDEPIDPARSGELALLDAVIQETLRINPVIAAVGRVLQRPCTVAGWTLPAGTMVIPNIYLTHHNPAVWPEPGRFDPTRFLGRKASPYAFFPFGGGIRRCIGMAFALYEMRIVLATALSRHRVRRVPGRRITPSRRSVTMAPSGDMPLILERR